MLAAFGEALIGQGRHRESRELCEEAIRIAQEVGALAQEGDARKALGVDLAFLGDLEAGVQELTEARRIAEVVGRVDEVARCYAMLSGLLETLGALDAAATVALEGAEQAASHGLGRWHSPFLTATAGRALFALGRWDEADVLLRRAADRVAPELAATRVFICSARSRLEIGRGRAELAAECLAEAGEAYLRTVKQPWFATPLFVATAELALLEGRFADADAAVAEGLQVDAGDLAFAAPLYVIGVRAAAERADLARARRAETELAKALELGDDLRPRAWCSDVARASRTIRSRHLASGPVPSYATRSLPDSPATAMPSSGKRPQSPGSGSPSRTQLHTPAGVRLRRCCWLVLPGVGPRRCYAVRTRRLAVWAPCRSAPKLRAWPAAAAST